MEWFQLTDSIARGFPTPASQSPRPICKVTAGNLRGDLRNNWMGTLATAAMTPVARSTARRSLRSLVRRGGTGARARSSSSRAGAATEETERTERGVPFSSDGAFFREESAQSRDLAVLLAATMRDDRRAAGDDELRVLDAMSGCGLRGSRYLLQGGASHAHCNDANPAVAATLAANLVTVGLYKL
jgi:hypothetical protein